MKIVFDHQILGWQKFGGVSRYISELSAKLSSVYNQRVWVVCPLYRNHYLDKATPELNIIGIPAPNIPKTGRIYRLINSFVSWPIVRFLQPDIVHETYYSSKRVAPKGTKTVLTVHDMIHERFGGDFSVFDNTIKEKALAIKRADHIICVSEQTRKDLIDLLGINPMKISVVYHGFDLTSQQPIMSSFENNKRSFLLYVGTRAGYKNFGGFLKAFSQSNFLKNNFDIVCFGGGRFSGKEISIIRHLGINPESVRQVSGDDNLLAGFYKAAKALVYPSLYEGFGIPPLEAMSFDCPVVCSNVSSIPEVVGDAGLMFDPYDIQSIKSALEKIVIDETLREDLINRGRARIKKFSWERCARETLDVYQKILA